MAKAFCFSPSNSLCQLIVICVCIVVYYDSDLAQDLVVLDEHFGYSYIELQLVSYHASVCVVCNTLLAWLVITLVFVSYVIHCMLG